MEMGCATETIHFTHENLYVGIFGGEKGLQWEESRVITGKWKIKLVFLYLKSLVFSINIRSQFYTIST